MAHALSDLRSPYYCPACRGLFAELGEDAVCPRCPYEPLVDVSSPARRQEVQRAEAEVRRKAVARWQRVVGLPTLAVIAGGALWGHAVLMDNGIDYVEVLWWEVPLVLPPLVLAATAAHSLIRRWGRRIARAVETRCGRPAGVADAIARLERR